MIFNNKQVHIFKKQFLLHMIALERFFGNKKIDIFLVGCLLIPPFNGMLIFPSNSFAIV